MTAAAPFIHMSIFFVCLFATANVASSLTWDSSITILTSGYVCGLLPVVFLASCR